jgi:hypothetical protein
VRAIVSVIFLLYIDNEFIYYQIKQIIMPVLSTTIRATHTNDMQVEVNFISHVIPPTTDAISIKVTFLLEGKEVYSSDKIVDPTRLQNNINHVISQDISFVGTLKLNTVDKIVLFDGGVTYSGQVYVGVAPVIIAAY